MMIVKLIIYGFIFAVSVVFITLILNQANILASPGISQRLAVFLTENTAATADNHRFKELNTPVFQESAEKLYKRVLRSAGDLGWEIVSHQHDELSANIIVRSRLFLFEDDVFVQVSAIDEEQSSVYIRSKSRVGKADFAANSAHIQLLIQKLQQ